AIGIASPTITLATTTFNVVSWNTMATDGSGVRIYPDRADVYLVANGENTQLAGDPGQKRDVRRITLRSTPPVMAPTAIQAVTCIEAQRLAIRGDGVGSEQPASPTVMIGTIFNRARGNCNTVDDALRISVTGTVPNSVGGTVTLVAQVDGGTPTTLASAIPFGSDGTWIVPVTLPQGNVTLTVKAEDVAFPVANVAPDLPVSFLVDTIAPVTTVSYPLDKARIPAIGGTVPVPVIGVTEPGSTLVVTLTRAGDAAPVIDAVSVPVATSTFAFRYPATGVSTGTVLVPGTYTLVVRTTDAAGNPGTDVTRTFKVTPPPVAASLLNPGDTTYPGYVGKAHDAEPDLYGIQVALRGQLPAGTLAEAVPDGLMARLRRNGKDAVGDGNRPVIAPVTLVASGTYGFTFPTLTFTADATAAYTVVTVDDFGNQSQESTPLNLVVDTTAPEFRVATPSDGQTIGSLSPELAILVNPNADGTWDITQATFEVRKTVEIGPLEAFRLVKSATVDPATLGASAAGAGVVRIDPSEWAPELERPVEPAITQKYELRVTGRDRLGNASSVTTMFTLRPGAPAVTILGDGNRVIGNLDVTRNTLPLVTTQVTVSGSDVSITGITGTIRQRGTTGAPIPLTLTGTGATRTVSLAGLVLPNGTAHDLAITATDSNAGSTTTTVTLRVVRPRAITVTVTKGRTPVAGATVRARRDAGDLPAVSVDDVTSGSGLVSFPAITGGPVLLAVGGVPGYPVTTVSASVTEPFATTGNAWPIAIDLDALNPNTITTTLRGLPRSVTTPVTGSVDDLVHISIEPQGGSHLTDVPVGSATSGLMHTYADDIATIDRTIVAPGLTVDGTGKFVTSTVRVPAGANAWTVTPSLTGAARTEATLIGTTSATAVFTATGGENLPVTLRYLASNLRVKTLTGTVRRVDQTTVAGATIIISQAGGLSVRAITGPDGTYGPVLIEGGDYTVAAIASPGANWIPDRAGRVSFATGDDALTPETDTVDLRVSPAGGVVQARLERAVSGDTSLITGTAILTGDGQVITARAGGSVLIGADEATGANVSIAAPAGVYVLTFIPDDGSLTSPEPMTIRVVDGRTLVLSSTELPPLTRQMGTLVGKVRLTDGTPLAGLTVQAHPDGVTAVTPAVTDGDGLYRLAVASGTYVISAVIPRGAALLPPNGVTASVAPSAVANAPDIILTAATAVIERTLVKAGSGTATIALSDAEAAGISGTAYIKDETTNVGTSISFNGPKIRVSVPPGSYRLSIAITAGGFLAPSPETGIIATAGVPATGERVVTPSNIVVSGQLVSNQTNASPGSSVALRSIVRATGITGAGSGTIYVTESNAAGAFTFKLAPGTWRLSASPDAGQGYAVNVDRPHTDVVVTATGTVTPSLPGIDLREANRVIQGTAVVEIDGTAVPLSGVKIRLDIGNTNGGYMSVTAETNSRGRFSALVAEGSVTLTANGANASFANATETTTSGRTAGDPAWVIDPVPTGVTDSDMPLTVSFVNASTVISGTVDRTSTDRVGGATITATSTSGLVRTTTSTTGSTPGSFTMRLSDGEWTIVANADLTLASGSRVAAASVPQVITVTGSNQTGISLALVASSTPIAPAASAPGDPETGAQVRAGFGSAELRLAPGAVSEAVTVTVEPLGNAPTLPGFVPFGDAFRIGIVTSSGQPVGALAVDSTVLITYPSATLARYRAPSTAPAGQTIAQPSDIRPARFDAITSAYTPLTNATASSPDTSTGQFAISTTTLGTFVLTTREVLVLAPVPPPPPSNGDGGGGGSGGPSATVKPVVIVPTVLAIAPTAVIGPPSPDLPAPFIADYVIVTEPFVLPPFTPFMTSGLRIPTDFSEGGLEPVVISPDRTIRLPDGRTELRATAQPGPAPIVVRVNAKETAAVTLTGGPVTLAFAVPNLVGEENAVVAVRIPASVFVAINRVAPDGSLTVIFDPAPPTANDVERGSLGGGGVTPLGMPFDLRMEVRAADGTGIPLKNLADPKPDSDASLPTVQVAMPVPGRYLNGGMGTFAYLLGLHDGTPSGGFLGYLRPPATFDGRAGTQTIEQPIDSFGGSLILPVDLVPSYVANHSADAHLWSGPTADAIDFGPVGEQFTLLTVVAPQVGFRINVYNPITRNYGWIDVDAVGPADAPATVTVLPTPTAMPSVPTITAVRPTLVQNVDAEAHLWSNPTTAAVDFGMVGRTGVIYTVIDQQMQRYFVVNEETGNYAWIDVSAVRPYVPVMTPSPTVTRV
ncbi:MAG: carboxypeptidase regulatory-like domain-containing protein, partial [Proteobacteria bacterium]|nr:carboxypeptidase regulatory-like domain-containing protein [Pseudomonadota bacterium]